MDIPCLSLSITKRVIVNRAELIAMYAMVGVDYNFLKLDADYLR